MLDAEMTIPERIKEYEKYAEKARDVEKKMIPAKMDWDLLDREGQAWMAKWDREVNKGRVAENLMAKIFGLLAPVEQQRLRNCIAHGLA